MHMVKEGLFGEVVHCSGGYCHDLRVRSRAARRTAITACAITSAATARTTRRTSWVPSRRCWASTAATGCFRWYPCPPRRRGSTITPPATRKSIPRWQRHISIKGGCRQYAHPVCRRTDHQSTLDTTLPARTAADLPCTAPALCTRRIITRCIWTATLPRRITSTGHRTGTTRPNTWKNISTRSGVITWKTVSAAGTAAWMGWSMMPFIEAVRKGEPCPIDVYDAAAWMCITPLSEQSIAMGSAPVPVPDFTSGAWSTRR